MRICQLFAISRQAFASHMRIYSLLLRINAGLHIIILFVGVIEAYHIKDNLIVTWKKHAQNDTF